MISFISDSAGIRASVENGIGKAEIKDRVLANAMYRALLFAKNNGELDAIFIEERHRITVSFRDTDTVMHLRVSSESDSLTALRNDYEEAMEVYEEKFAEFKAETERRKNQRHSE